jgi:hypothetical protein
MLYISIISINIGRQRHLLPAQGWFAGLRGGVGERRIRGGRREPSVKLVRLREINLRLAIPQLCLFGRRRSCFCRVLVS